MKRLQVNGTELWCDDRGSGLSLLLVHGFPLDHTMWAGQLDEGVSPLPTNLRSVPGEGHAEVSPLPLGEGQGVRAGGPTGSREERPVGPRSACSTLGGLRLIAPDLPGFGRSPARPGKGDCPPLFQGTVPFSRDEGETVTMAQFADDLAGLLDALEIAEPAVLCGLSMGGYIALQFWRRHAPRLRALILCDTRAAADAPEAAAARLVMAERVLREGPAPLVESMLPRVLGETTRRERPQLVESLRRVMMANPPQGIAAAARGMAERPDMTAALAEIRCPTLVLVGAEDVASTPAEMRGMAQAIPGAKFVEIPAAGHLSPLENPAAVNAAILQFLKNVQSA